MSDPGSITKWLTQLQQGDQEAVGPLWAEYFRRLAGVARGQMGNLKRGMNSESDVALEAFHSFCRGVGDGKFSELKGRDELWRILAVIARRKAINTLRHELALIRGGGKTKGEDYLSEFADEQPSPEQSAELLDELQHLLRILRNENATLALIGLRKSEGFTNQEIAAELRVAVRTVERKMLLIYNLWAEDLDRRFPE